MTRRFEYDNTFSIIDIYNFSKDKFLNISIEKPYNRQDNCIKLTWTDIYIHGI